MKQTVYIVADDGERLDFTLDVGKRSKLSLSVREGRLTVRVPVNYSTAQVKSFINENLEWVRSSLERSIDKSGLPRRFEDGECIRLLGEELVISAVKAPRHFEPRIEGGRLLVSVSPSGAADRQYMASQVMGFITDLAKREIFDSIMINSQKMGLYPKQVTVKSMTASWGRCSSEGNISINYKVVAYSRRHIDYVCIHELAHLEYMDHSPQFWALVGKFCPDWKELRGSMRS